MCAEAEEAKTKIDRLITALEHLCALIERQSEISPSATQDAHEKKDR